MGLWVGLRSFISIYLRIKADMSGRKTNRYNCTRSRHEGPVLRKEE